MQRPSLTLSQVASLHPLPHPPILFLFLYSTYYHLTHEVHIRLFIICLLPQNVSSVTAEALLLHLQCNTEYVFNRCLGPMCI